ncbi:hypothetical protein K432DRAFT_449998, partial [Lepidopterella palustris CBS 459.81]
IASVRAIIFYSDCIFVVCFHAFCSVQRIIGAVIRHPITQKFTAKVPNQQFIAPKISNQSRFNATEPQKQPKGMTTQQKQREQNKSAAILNYS